MSELERISSAIIASVEAEYSGVIVDWKQMCLNLVNAARQDYERLSANLEKEE